MSLQLVDAYRLPPGCCPACGAPRLPAVTTGIDVHQPGALHDTELVLCHSCILTMARLVAPKVGVVVVPVGELADLRGQIEILYATLANTEAERDRALEARDAVLASVNDRPPASSNLSSEAPSAPLAPNVASTAPNPGSVEGGAPADEPPPKRKVSK